jgi:hypothetical protein
LFALASLWICAIFLPLLYSLVFPNKDIQGVVSALEQHGVAPPEATTTVEETLAAAGPLTRAIPLAYYSGVTTTMRSSGSQTIRKKQASYVAWFQKRSKALVLLVTAYEADGGRKAYEINEGEAMSYVRGYSLPVLMFGASLVLVRKRKARESAV